MRRGEQNDKECMDACLEEVRLLQMINARDPQDQRHIARLYDYFYHMVRAAVQLHFGMGRLLQHLGFAARLLGPSYAA